MTRSRRLATLILFPEPEQMSTHYFLATGAYIVVTFILGFVWHLVLFKKTYQRLGIFSRIDDPIIPLGLTAMILQGLVLAYLYPHIFTGGPFLSEGLRFGLLMGLFIASSAVFAEAAKQRVTSLPIWLALESAYYLIQFGLSGIAIAFVYAGRDTQRLIQRRLTMRCSERLRLSRWLLRRLRPRSHRASLRRR